MTLPKNNPIIAKSNSLDLTERLAQMEFDRCFHQFFLQRTEKNDEELFALQLIRASMKLGKLVPFAETKKRALEIIEHYLHA